MNLEKLILDHFHVLDESVDELSNHNEGELTGLPSWVHTTRKITVGLTGTSDGIVLKVLPDTSLSADVVEITTVKSPHDISEIIAPMNYSGPLLQSLPEDFFVLMGDMLMIVNDNPLLQPALDNRSLIGWGRQRGLENAFSISKAKEEAINLWNNRLLGKGSACSYTHEVKIILERLESVIKRKAFLERRVHRFIHDHKAILLPQHRRCLYEHPLHRGDSVRKADFILEREQGLPPLLIELESPVHQVFTKSMDLTASANHACQQIAEWVSFIDMESANTSDEYGFLAGPKERLVVIGRGLEHKQRLIETKFGGTTIWTYELFIEEARRRLNNSYASQCQLLGMDIQRPL